MAIDAPHFSSLPQEVQGVIFSHLDYKTLGSCSCVCEEFKTLASADGLWTSLFLNIPFPSTIRLKEYLNKHAVSSLDKVVEHFQLFANSVKLGTKGTFTILCPLNSDKRAGGVIEIGATRDASEPEQHLQATCILFKEMNTHSLNCSVSDESGSSVILGSRFSESRRFNINLPVTQEYLQMQGKMNKITDTRMAQLRREQPLETRPPSTSSELPLLCRFVKSIFDCIFG